MRRRRGTASSVLFPADISVCSAAAAHPFRFSRRRVSDRRGDKSADTVLYALPPSSIPGILAVLPFFI